jgi:hypothetical protein
VTLDRAAFDELEAHLNLILDAARGRLTATRRPPSVTLPSSGR